MTPANGRPIAYHGMTQSIIMKTVLLLAIAAAFSLSGCGGVAVVETPRPVVGYSVHHYHGRPYYYTGHTRYWGYPPGYVVPRAHHSHVVVY
jgi:hypothetical protein